MDNIIKKLDEKIKQGEEELQTLRIQSMSLEDKLDLFLAVFKNPTSRLELAEGSDITIPFDWLAYLKKREPDYDKLVSQLFADGLIEQQVKYVGERYSEVKTTGYFISVKGLLFEGYKEEKRRESEEIKHEKEKKEREKQINNLQMEHLTIQIKESKRKFYYVILAYIAGFFSPIITEKISKYNSPTTSQVSMPTTSKYIHPNLDTNQKIKSDTLKTNTDQKKNVKP